MSKPKQSPGYGHHGSASQPGTSTPRKLRQWAQSGNGELGAFQREVNRMFRQSTDSYVRPDAHVIDVEDVFKGLNLDSEAEGKLSAVLTQTRSEYGPHPQLRVPRIVHARIRLMDTLRAMKQIDSTTRMEIQRRAMAYWKRNHPDYDQAPTIRYVAMGKSMKKSRFSKADKKRGAQDEDDAAVASYFPGEEEDDGDGYDDYDEGDEGDGYDEEGEEGGEEGDEGYGDEAGGATSHPSDRRAQPEGDEFNSLSPEEQMQVIDEALAQGEISEEEAEEARAEIGGGEEVDQNIVSAVEAMEEVEIEGGRILHFGQGIEAHLPDDADFHHHATEYAKHRAGYQINKDKDPEMADAHKHAANIHASVGNAMHSAGDLERRRLPGSDGSGTAESHDAALAQTEAGAVAGGPNPDMGEPEDLPMPGGPLGTNGPGGAPAAGGPPPKPGGGMQVPSPRDDISGGEQPGMPDMQRNAPGRDSDFEVAQKMSGKLRALVGKMVPKQVMGGGRGKRAGAPIQPQSEIYRHVSSTGDVMTEKHNPTGGVSQHARRRGNETPDVIIGRARLIGKLNGVAAKMMGYEEDEEQSSGFVGKQRQQIRGVQLMAGRTPTHTNAGSKRVHGGGMSGKRAPNFLTFGDRSKHTTRQPKKQITGKMAHFVMVGKDVGGRGRVYAGPPRSTGQRARGGGRRMPLPTRAIQAATTAVTGVGPEGPKRPGVARSTGPLTRPQMTPPIKKEGGAAHRRPPPRYPNLGTRHVEGNPAPSSTSGLYLRPGLDVPGRSIRTPSGAERRAARGEGQSAPAEGRGRGRRRPRAAAPAAAAAQTPSPAGGSQTGSSSPRGASTRQSILNDMAALRHGRATRELFRSDVLLVVPAGKRLKKSK